MNQTIRLKLLITFLLIGAGCGIRFKGVTISPPVSRTAEVSTLPNGLVGLWHLDGDFNDSISTNHLIATNSPATGLPGKIDKSVYFNGINEYACAPSNAAMNSRHFTISLWAAVDGGQGAIRAVLYYRAGGGATGPGGRGFNIYAMSDNRYQAWLGSGANNWPFAWGIAQGPLVMLGQWTHHVIQYDGLKFRYYVDGSLQQELMVSYQEAPGSPFCIGSNGSGLPAQGHFDELAMWDRALSDSEIAALYSQGQSGVTIKP